MCGITGILNLDEKEICIDILKKMTKSLEHRGPDGEGFFLDKIIGFGHRRLAIIDLSSAGTQPMISQDGNFIISYNGEVYNFKELREELEKLGYKFKSKTDTEVVLYSYVEWNYKCLSRFNGMFAFSIWDKKNKCLFLARDRYGIKPLYYTLQNNSFLFASEIKSFFNFPTFRVKMNYQGLQEYMTFQNYISDNTLFDNVKVLPPGSYITINSDSKEISKPLKYWDFNFKNNNLFKDKKEYLEEFDRLFLQAIKRQLVSDVEIGTYLSGGIDSGLITAKASNELSNLKTFTVGFFGNDSSETSIYDERNKAELMSYLFKTEHYEYVLKPYDLQSKIQTLIWHIEEPRVGHSLPNYFAAKLAGKFVKVVLSGSGGDELFGGYPWRYLSAIHNNNFAEYLKDYYISQQRNIPVELFENLFQPIWNEIKHIDIYQLFENKCKNQSIIDDNINNSFYFDAQTFLHGILTVEDKLSMAHSLETRLPFLDNDLVEFAQSIPIDLKIKDFNRNNMDKNTLIGKSLLREAIKKHVPTEISNGIKQGFVPPKSWSQIDKIPFINKMLKNKNAKIYSFINYKIIQKYLDKKNNYSLIWSLLNLETWCQNFLEKKK
jgi:asparagine synthase (glutamine-hydrolysing)